MSGDRRKDNLYRIQDYEAFRKALRLSTDKIVDVDGDLQAHIDNLSNPHQVTKSQVGLGSVENYPVATQAQAEAGVDNGSYMTPLRTSQAIEEQSGDNAPVQSVFGRIGEVDAQSGDYSWEQIDKTVSNVVDITNRSHTDLTDIGTNSHSDIDSHIADDGKHREINDSGVTTTDLWSADKISSELADKYDASNPDGFISDLSGLTTTDLTEGSNLYYTDSRVNSAIDTRVDKSFVEALNIDITEAQISDLGNYIENLTGFTTTDLTEGLNLYFTEARANNAIDSRVTKAFVEALGIDITEAQISDLQNYLTSVSWGDIGGTLSNQTDLQTALDSKLGVDDFAQVEQTSIDNRLDIASNTETTEWIVEQIDEVIDDLDTHVTNDDIHREINDSGSAVTDLWSADKIGSELDLKIPLSQKASASGVATLDSNAKIPIEQIPESVVAGESYLGTWDADTNTPTLTSTPSDAGDFYVVSVAGTQFSIAWQVGDQIRSDGTDWQRVPNIQSITSVFGRDGVVVAETGDYSFNQISGSVSDGQVPESSVVQHEGAIDHDALTNYQANQHRVWESSIAQNVHVDNIPNLPTSKITSGTFTDARISQSSVTQHQSALTITEAQISDLKSYLTDLTGLDTDDLIEGITNLYYTDARANSAIDARVTKSFVEALGIVITEAQISDLGNYIENLSSFTTSDLTEGTNLYYTDARANAAIDTRVTKAFVEALNIVITEAQISDLGNYIENLIGFTTTDLAEGTNLYYTDARANSAIDTRVTKGFVETLNIDITSDQITDFGTPAQQEDLDVVETTSIDNRLDIASNIETTEWIVKQIDEVIDELDGKIEDLSTFTTDDLAEGATNKYNATHTGQVVGSTNLTITNKAVSNQKLADMNQNTIKGRINSGAGNPQDLSAEQVRTILNVEDGAQVNTVDSVNGETGVVVLDTDDVNEGLLNLYYTDVRANSAIDARVTKAFVEALNISVTEAQISDLKEYLTNLTGQDTDDLAEGLLNLYYTDARANSAIDSRVTKAFVEALNINVTEAQITDLQSYLKSGDNISELINNSGYITDYTVTEGDVTTHQAALVITESQISDLKSYLTDLTGQDTDDLAEGLLNLYYTTSRVNSDIDSRVTKAFVEALGINITEAQITDLGNYIENLTGFSTTDLAEGTNLYHTDARAVSAIKADSDWNATDWDIAFTERRQWNGGATNLDAETGRTSLNVPSNDDLDTVEDTTISNSLDSSADRETIEWIVTELDEKIEDLSSFDTDDLVEGTNLYYTDARVSANADVDANTIHRDLTNNPHAVTKSQVGLGSVENYAVASQAQAEAGSNNSTYMTPLRVNQRVNLLQLNNWDGEAGGVFDLQNAKATLEISNIENYGIATQGEAEAGSVNNKYMTPLRTSQAITEQQSVETGLSVAVNSDSVVKLGDIGNTDGSANAMICIYVGDITGGDLFRCNPTRTTKIVKLTTTTANMLAQTISDSSTPSGTFGSSPNRYVFCNAAGEIFYVNRSAGTERAFFQLTSV